MCFTEQSKRGSPVEKRLQAKTGQRGRREKGKWIYIAVHSQVHTHRAVGISWSRKNEDVQRRALLKKWALRVQHRDDKVPYNDCPYKTLRFVRQ